MQTSPNFSEKEFRVVIRYSMAGFDKTKEVVVTAIEDGNAKYEAQRLYGKNYPNIQRYTVV